MIYGRPQAHAAERLLVALPLLLVGAVIVSLAIGAVTIPLERVAGAIWARVAGMAPAIATDSTIIWDFRLPRALLAAVLGAGLASAGAAYQAIFRNPLADPFVIGASGGAALGATLAITAGLPLVMPASFVGAVAAVCLVYVLAQGAGRPAAVNLLLAGAALGTLLSSAVTLLMYLNDRSLQEVFSWLMGGLNGRTWQHLWVAAPAIGLGGGFLWALARPLDALACGEESAQGLGLNLPRARFAVVGAATLVTAAAVASGGIIGFVGLLAPHAARRLGGGAHRRLIPLSALLGALLLLIADDLARTVLAPVELPVGVLMALLGAPFFLWLLRSRPRG